jgi:uncharacterized C2H2 Zn-finger protein
MEEKKRKRRGRKKPMDSGDEENEEEENEPEEMRKRERKEDTLFPCSKCDKVYKEKRRFNEHFKRTHGEENHSCPHCRIQLRDSRSIPRHVAKCPKRPMNQSDCVLTPRAAPSPSTSHKVFGISLFLLIFFLI